MRPFGYERPATLDEALGLLGPSARPLAGGTDLLPLMKADLAAPERLVAVRRLLPSAISVEDEGIDLGAGALLSAIEADENIRSRYAALAQAAALAASAQLRNMATLGGNLLQRPRCWYFRDPHVRCWLQGGADCPARDGENRQHALFSSSPCVAVHPSDLAAALLAFDAAVRVRASRGERLVPLAELFAEPEEKRRTETTLAEDELVLGLSLPSHPAETKSAYLKAMDRAAFSFALAGVAAVLRIGEHGKIGHARLVLSGVAPVPRRAQAAEQVLLGAEPGEALFERAAAAAVEGAQPLAHNGYKMPLVRALVRRALRSLS